MADQLGLLWIGDQAPVFYVVAKRWHTAHPHAFALAGGDLVPDPLPGNFAFKLCKREQHIEHESSHGGCGVELLRHGDKGHTLALKHLDHLGKVGQAARQSVNLVDHNHVNLACLNVGHQALESGALHVSAGEGRVVIVVGDRNPAFGALAGNIGMACVTLRINRVVFLIQPFFTGLTGVDGAAHAPFQHVAHDRPPFLVAAFFSVRALRPKNTGPDHRVPVISRAIWERLWNVRPSKL